MKRTINIIIAAAVFTAALSPILAFEGDDDNVLRDVFVLQYKSELYVSDFAKKIGNNRNKHCYRELREYINRKNEVLRVLRMAGDEYYYGLSYNRQSETDYLQRLTDDLKGRKPDERILLRFNSVRPNFNFNGDFSVDNIQKTILPKIKTRIDETNLRDSLNEVTYKQIQKNIGLIMQDVFLAEEAILAVLSPESRDQQFRMWISIVFSGLIAVLMLAFFAIIFRRSDTSLSKHLLNGAGLQFITVFILIIAIILFGILKILGGSELAAILSGISGYILGKGNTKADDTNTAKSAATGFDNINSIGSIEGCEEDAEYFESGEPQGKEKFIRR